MWLYCPKLNEPPGSYRQHIGVNQSGEFVPVWYFFFCEPSGSFLSASWNFWSFLERKMLFSEFDNYVQIAHSVRASVTQLTIGCGCFLTVRWPWRDRFCFSYNFEQKNRLCYPRVFSSNALPFVFRLSKNTVPPSTVFQWAQYSFSIGVIFFYAYRYFIQSDDPGGIGFAFYWLLSKNITAQSTSISRNTIYTINKLLFSLLIAGIQKINLKTLKQQIFMVYRQLSRRILTIYLPQPPTP